MMQKVLCLSILFTLLLLFPITNFAHALCVEAPVANLRKGPGTNYNISWQVFKYMPFKKLDKKGDWYKVQDLDGDVHWIYAKLVTDKFDCAVVKVDEANVRSGPGLNFGETMYAMYAMGSGLVSCNLRISYAKVVAWQDR